MILTCPQCATRYLLPAHMLSPEGRRVKCSHCHDVWFQLPDSEEVASNQRQPYDDIPEGVRPIPDGSNLPTLQEEETSTGGGRARLFGYATAAIIFGLIFGALIMFQPLISKKMPFTQSFYALIGHSVSVAGANLTFDALEAKSEPDSAGEKISIIGTILNATEKEETVPLIEAQMKNEAGDILERWIIRPPEPSIPAQGTLAFSTNYLIATPGAATGIHLQFVSP